MELNVLAKWSPPSCFETSSSGSAMITTFRLDLDLGTASLVGFDSVSPAASATSAAGFGSLSISLNDATGTFPVVLKLSLEILQDVGTGD